MKFFKTLNKKIKKLDVWDIGCIKWSCILFGAVVGAYIAGFVKQYLIAIIVIMIVLAIRPIIKWFKKV